MTVELPAMNDTAYGIVEVVVMLLTCMAFVTGVAIRRTPRIQESPHMNTARHLLIGAWGLLSARMLYIVFLDFGRRMPTMDLICLGLMALGATMMSMSRLSRTSSVPCQHCPFYEQKEKPDATHIRLAE